MEAAKSVGVPVDVPVRSEVETDGRAAFFVEANRLRLRVVHWPCTGRRGASMLLVHGTGYVADMWAPIAQMLASRYDVYAYDRRGHGGSDSATGRLQLLDFAQDVIAVCEALELKQPFGVGHSAGGTDLLIAAARRAGVFSRLFALEPICAPPAVGRNTGEESAETRAFVEQVRKRRGAFESRPAALEHLRGRFPFKLWDERVLHEYVSHAFRPLSDGGVELCCTPETEAELTRLLGRASSNFECGDARGDPFADLSRIGCPVRIGAAEHSIPLAGQMARFAAAAIPGADIHPFAGARHFVPWEAPATVARALLDFAEPALA